MRSWRFVSVGTLWLVTAFAAVGQWVLLARADPVGELTAHVIPVDFTAPLFGLALATVGAMVVLRGDAARYGWLMLATGFSIGVTGFTGAYAVYAGEADVPLAAPAAWLQDLWMISQMLGFLLLPALFPDGSVASPRWRVPVKLVTAAWVILIVVFAFAQRSVTNWFLEVDNPPDNPVGFLPIPEMAVNLAWLCTLLASFVIGLGSVITRWRRTELEVRQQLKWVLYAFGLLLTFGALGLVVGVLDEVGVDLGLVRTFDLLGALVSVGLPVAIGWAVFKFRLYDVDLVINRTMVYAALTVLVVATYVAGVVGVGAVLPVEQSFLALVTTGVVAVAFAPLRDRLQSWVNRMMFGRRDDPYAVLSEMGRLMAGTGSPENTLQTLTEIVATSLKLPGAAVELEQGGEWTVQASFGEVVEDRGVAVPLRHEGEVVGRMVVMPRSSWEPLSSQDLALLKDVAHPAGAIARSVRLTAALQSSRERLVLAREEERRRIRRDLHDGLGPSLASQTFRFDEVLDRLHDDPAGAADLVKRMKAQNQQLVADIRRLVYELRPPALDDLGVAEALAAHVAQFEQSSTVRIEVETFPDPLPALPAAVEVAAYRIAREAITNSVRHAAAEHCKATLHASESEVTIEVRDNGVGVGDGGSVGVGISSMRERTEELGGAFSIGTMDSGGTRVAATLPLGNGVLGRRSDAPGEPGVRHV